MADKNGNENYLREMQCPECGQAEHMEVTAVSTFRLYDKRTANHNCTDFGDGENARCHGCDYTGSVGDFREAYHKTHDLPVSYHGCASGDCPHDYSADCIRSLGEHAGQLELDNKKLRELLAMAYSGVQNLYTDDGELTDSSGLPDQEVIDYCRDPVPEIARKIEARGFTMIEKLRACGVNDVAAYLEGNQKQGGS